MAKQLHRALALLFFICVLATPQLAPAWFSGSQNGLPDFTELAEKAGKAVVNISTVKTVKGQGQLQDFFQQHQRPDGPFGDFFDQFEKFFGGQQGKPRKQEALGSGFIISKDGYVVTNNHVIAEADEVKVKLQGEEKEYDAVVKGRDPEMDLALLKIEAGNGLPVLDFADSTKAKVGEWVLAIGNPFGLGHTVTAGIISAKGRIIHAGPYDNFLQTDASINPGNSGGPLINMQGEVVGINTAIVASGQGIGFAIPSSMAKDIISQLKTTGKVSRGWLGVTIQNVDENTAKALGLKEPAGALVAQAMEGNPAAKAGIKAGDVILKVDDQAIGDADDLTRAIGKLPPGTVINLSLWRKGKTIDAKVTLGERDAKKLAQGQGQPEDQDVAEALGMSLRSVNKDDEAKALGLDKPRGLLVLEVDPQSLAAEQDVRPGDVVLEVNQQPVNTVDAFKKVVDTEGKDKGVIMLLIKRRGQNIFRTIPLDKKADAKK